MILGSVSATTPGTIVGIRKVNPDNSLAWIAALSFNAIQKSLSVDTLEQYVYVAAATNPLDVVRFGASTGAIVDEQRHSFLTGQSHDIRIHTLSDGSGYYVTGLNAGKANI